MRNTKQDIGGTSFWGDVVEATTEELIEILGEPLRSDFDKSTRDFEAETEKGDVFTVYDWKEYRQFPDDEKISWHIGAKNKQASFWAKVELRIALEYIRAENGVLHG